MVKLLYVSDVLGVREKAGVHLCTAIHLFALGVVVREAQGQALH